MDNFSVRSERNFHNLAAKPKRMHLLDKPNGYASAMVKNSLSHQMRFTVQMLEEELCVTGDPHVLQIKLLGDDSRELSSWKLFADGTCIASGSGDFACECFCEGAEVFLDLCRDAVRAAELRQWSQGEYELLSVARGIAGAQANAGCIMMACSHRMPPLKSHDVKRLTLVYAFDSPKALAKFIDAAARYAAVKRC